MLCEYCGRREGEQKIIIKDNVKRTVWICRECEAQRLASFMHTKPDAQSGYVQSGCAPTPKPYAPRDLGNTLPFLVCSGCGRTTDDFVQTMLVGCERCYNDLAPVLAQTVRRCQPSTVHVGASPSYVHQARGSEYEHLRAQLARAVKEERYAEAAEYKRLLDGLKGGK